MARQDPILVAFQRGEISTQLLGRTDLEHLRLAAQIQENWQPRVLGPMTLRPGSEYLGTVNQGNVPTSFFQFIAGARDRAAIELQPNQLRIWTVNADDTITLVSRAPVGTVVPGFDSGAWFVTQRTGTTTVAIGGGAGLQFNNINVGANVGAAVNVTIASGDVGIEHAVRLVVSTGPITFSVGSSLGLDDLFGEETLDTGAYSMAFTPTAAGNIVVQFASAIGPENKNTISMTQPQGNFLTQVASIALETPGPMVLPTPWGAAVLTDQPNGIAGSVRQDASADVTFVACVGVPQQQINRYSATSWSVVLYKPVKGPMSAVPGSPSTILSVSDKEGNQTLTSNQNSFTPDDVGTLFRLFHQTQTISQILSFPNTFTDAIRITGVSSITQVSGGTTVDVAVPDRNFAVAIGGSWTGAVVIQRSFSGYVDDFADYITLTANGTRGIVDFLNNEIVYYRVVSRAPTGNVNCELTTTAGGNCGGGAGVCLVTGYVSPSQLNIEILVPFLASNAASDWRQEEWSGLKGFPTSTAIHEGRLWWVGADRWWGSASDDYTNFDFDAIGDAAYIDIQVGQGPIANINWLLSLDGLLGGADTSIISARSDAIQTPLTPTNINLRFSTTQGSAAIQAVKIDNVAIFVNQSNRRIYSAIYDLYTYNYKATELSDLNPDIGAPGSAPDAHTGGYIGMAIQRNPDNNIHLIRSDGQIVCLVLDEADDVKAFWRKTTQGAYDNVIVLPAPIEDMVLVSVIRNGVRYFERFSRLDECTGDLICKLCDSFGTYQGAPTNTFTAPWLADQQVSVWIDGTDACLTMGEDGQNPAGFTYDSEGNGVLQLDRGGTGVLPTTAQNITFGLQYKSGYLSTKLAYAAQQGTAINETKRVDHLGVVLQNTHAKGLRYSSFILNPQQGMGDFGSDFGSDFSTGPNNPFYDNLSPVDDLPEVEQGVIVPANWIWKSYDQRRWEFPADSSTDNRIWFTGCSPRPVTVLAATFEIETND